MAYFLAWLNSPAVACRACHKANAPRARSTAVRVSPAIISQYAACHSHGVVIERYRAALSGKRVSMLSTCLTKAKLEP